MEGVITRSKGSRQKDDASKSKGHKSGPKGSVTSSSKRSETSSVLKACAAAREAKLQVEMEALKPVFPKFFRPGAPLASR